MLHHISLIVLLGTAATLMRAEIGEVMFVGKVYPFFV